MKKLLTTSKVFSAETIGALNVAAKGSTEAIAMACMDGAKINIARDKFLMELRRVCALPCNTAAASAGLRAAAEDGANVATVATAIAAQYEKDRLGHIARRKAQKDKSKGDGGNGDGGNGDGGNGKLTLAQLEARRDLLKKELSEIESLIRAAKMAAATSQPQGDAAVGGC